MTCKEFPTYAELLPLEHRILINGRIRQHENNSELCLRLYIDEVDVNRTSCHIGGSWNYSRRKVYFLTSCQSDYNKTIQLFTFTCGFEQSC